MTTTEQVCRKRFEQEWQLTSGVEAAVDGVLARLPADRHREFIDGLIGRLADGVETGRYGGKLGEVYDPHTTDLNDALELAGRDYRLEPDDLPLAGAGVCIWAGVVVCLDPDLDPRVIAWVRALPPAARLKLVAVSESKGSLDVVWDGPPLLAVTEVVSCEAIDDSWVVVRSVSLQDLQRNRGGL